MNPCSNCGAHIKVCVDCDLYNGKYVELPENATNGDVLKSLFPALKTRYEEGSDFIEYTLDGVVGTLVSLSWWNAKYE